MIRRLILLVIASFTLTALPAASLSVSAVPVDPNDPLSRACNSTTTSGSSSTCEATDEDPITGAEGILTRATEIVATIVGVAAVIMIIIGGFKYMTSSGDPANLNSAKNTILYALIGLVIALVAQGIVLFVLRKL